VVRLQNVSPLGFEVRFQEWDYRWRDFNDYFHPFEDISYLIAQPGRHVMSDGSIWEVGTFSLSGTRIWKPYAFAGTFAAAPRLFLTVQTANGGEAVSVRARNVSATVFEAALYEEEALNDGHSSETVGYLAIYSGGDGGLVEINGYEVPYLLESHEVNHLWSPLPSGELKVEEELSQDDETWHVTEAVDVLAVGSQIFAQQVSSRGGDTTALRRR